MKMKKHNGNGNHILQDIAIIVLSVLVAILLVRTDTLENLLLAAESLGVWSAFVAGLFFTSIFTTAPAIAALGEISLLQGIFSTALFGAAGCVVGDLIIFRFFRNRLSEHIAEIVTHRSVWRRFHLLFARRFFRWITFFVGGFILASPLPEELGIAILGFSRMRVKYFAVLSFVFNFLGIAVIGLIARSIAT
ncbi:hypothetical protein A3C94_02060 [Candidatus Kaiserbacteria bacterium RIFCSPHIGHO2_02_FULL_55_17]|uniref:Uncharacterized protein n=1 Tax=Candidatus Kaiserbacteria bacterium RIFCSPHIGHO2_02_FULL_55_17 TaxID=1798496 RepID=A0A1F6DSP9_9BACT|nr:MAG: hypothetical protein A3C94_02060 [Candidatus Kaiserbacteria bacterium RIFCSPHIGHO2_02_FULL_55_17]